MSHALPMEFMHSSPGHTLADTVGWALALLLTLFSAWSNAGPTVAGISCVTLLLSFLLVRKSCRPFVPNRITLPGFWYVTYLAFILWPAFYVYAQHDGPYRSGFLWAALSVLITVPFGWLVANQVWAYRMAEAESFFRTPVSGGAGSPRFSTAFVRCFIFAAVMTVLYLYEVKAVPLFYLLSHPGDALTLAVLREESFKLLDSPFLYIYALVKIVFYPFLIMVSWGAYLVTTQRQWMRWFGITLAAGVLFSAFTLAKAPVATIFLMLGFFVYYYRKGRPSRRLVTMFVILILLFPVGVVGAVYFNSDLGLQQAVGVFQGLGDRLFHVPAEMIYYYFEFFPARMSYLHGASIGRFSALFGMTHVDTPNVVGQYAFPAALESITANAAFIGDLHADFGIWGVLLGGILAGFVMQGLHIYLIRRRKTVVTLAAYAFLTVTFWFLHSTSLAQILASNGALLVLLLVWAFEKGAAAGLAGAENDPMVPLPAPHQT
jgi:Putative O-antigen polymerase